MELAKGIYHFPTGPFNWYVIEEGGRLTLVDAGFPGHFGVFSDGVRSIGREMKDVEAVILSHAHADHMGSPIAWRRAQMRRSIFTRRMFRPLRGSFSFHGLH